MCTNWNNSFLTLLLTEKKNCGALLSRQPLYLHLPKMFQSNWTTLRHILQRLQQLKIHVINNVSPLTLPTRVIRLTKMLFLTPPPQQQQQQQQQEKTTKTGQHHSQLIFKFTDIHKMCYSLNICPYNFLHMPKKPTNYSLVTNGKVLLRPL